jgi:hypothetical protein
LGHPGPAVNGGERSYALGLVAAKLIYGEWAHQPSALPDGYAATALPIVNAQLEKAGLRLAALLNRTLK